MDGWTDGQGERGGRQENAVFVIAKEEEKKERGVSDIGDRLRAGGGLSLSWRSAYLFVAGWK